MEGKTIIRVLDLGSNYQALLLDDDEVAIIKIVVPDLSLDELNDFIGKSRETEKPVTKDTKEVGTKKETKKAVKEEPKDDENYTWEDLSSLKFKELVELCKESDLDTDPEDYEEDEIDELRKAIAKEVEIEIPDSDDESEEEEEEEDDKPTKGSKSTKDDDDDYTWEDLSEMDFEELEDLCDEEDLDTDPNDFDEDEESKFRKAIAKELGIEPPKSSKRKS